MLEKTKVNRIIALINEDLINRNDLAQELYRKGAQADCPIIYLVLVSHEENMTTVIRNMATMKAVTAANRLAVEVKTALKSDWLVMLKKMAKPGDVIFCQEEQTVKYEHLKTIPVCDFLASQVSIPVEKMTGFYHPIRSGVKNWLHGMIGVIGLLVILAGFTWLQIRLEQALTDPLSTIYIIITFLLELGSVVIWNKFAF